MFFTREDILKIQNALLKLSVKDSELPSAEPVTYDDILSIVQDGKNKQIKIKDFFNQISLWKREDFINITDKYDEHYISLIKAISLVPILQRKDGLVITFQDVEGNWEIYQFRGNITEFFEEDKWFNLYDYRNNIIQSIVPDEEDLTTSIPDENGNSLVSLKNRVYDPTSFSGKGYKILRKNIQSVNIAVTKIKVEFSPSSDGTLSFSINGKETQVSVSTSVDNTTILVADKIASKLIETMTEYKVLKDASTITLIRKFGGSVTPSLFSASTTGVVCTVTDSSKRESRNIITKDMITKSNTIYEIRYDFDLNGETIEMKEGCILKFNGGSLSSGKIVGAKTLIEANVTGIFGDSFSLEGTFENIIAYPEWFKLTSDIDDTNSIQKVLNLFHSVRFLNKTYIVSSTLNTNNAYILKGSSNKYGKSVICYKGDSALFNLTSPQSLNYIIFENIALEGYATEDGYVFQKNSICINQKEPVSFEIKNVLIEGFEYGIKAEIQTYYNYIETSRFNNVKYCLCDFNANNFKIVGVRASYFHTFISLTSGDGPLVIENGCFEVFNGSIVRSKYEIRSEVIFSKNYVETYGDRKLPSGYSDNNEIYFGNSSLFTGIFGALSLLDNMFQINDSSYLVYSRLMNAFTCIRNGFYVDKENTNLERIYHIEKVYTVNIENFYSKLSTKNYNKTLKESIIDGFNIYNFKIYDSIFDKKYNKYLGIPVLADGVSSLDTNAIRHWSDGRDLIFKGILIKGSTNDLIDLSSYTLNIPNNFTFHVVDSNNNIIPLTLDKSSKVLSIANNNIDNLGNLIFDNFRIPLMEFN